MAFKITEILGALNEKGGVLRSANFNLTFTKPNWFIADRGGTTRNLSFFCSSSHLPGATFDTADVQPYGYGLNEKRALRPTYAEWPVGVMVDGGGDTAYFFNTWLQYVCNFNNEADRGANPNDLHYPDDYQTTAEITQYHENGHAVMKYTLHNAYPSAVNDTPVAWGAHDEILMLDVRIAYKKWTIEYMSPTNNQNPAAPAAPAQPSAPRTNVNPGITRLA